jgi:transglutaminase-like putative cysteine protease
VTRAAFLEESGRFREAEALLDSAVATAGSDRVNLLSFERDRLQRIRIDFPLSRDRLFARVRAALPDLSEAEFNRWITEGRFERRSFDGTDRFASIARSNLFWRHPELNSRRVSPPDDSAFEHAIWEAARRVTEAARAAGTPYVLPHRFRVVMEVTADSGAANAGDTVRAWLPIPRSYPHQTDFRLLSSSPPVLELAADNTPIRSAYMEQIARDGYPTLFSITYEYTSSGVRLDPDPAPVVPSDPSDPELAPFLAEGPHVQFTDTLRRVSKAVVGDETNPLEKARKIYDWISTKFLYSYAVEYSTMRNISDACLRNGHGDCGMHALLFITLCRMNGIPARWQSGWFTFPGGKTIHDWAEIHIAPTGWMPVDVDMGVFAARYYTSLSAEQREELRKFFFGGLDPWRIAANSDHNRELTPARRTFRSDPVDFQRGELEAGGKNIYFDRFSYSLRVEEQKTP